VGGRNLIRIKIIITFMIDQINRGGESFSSLSSFSILNHFLRSMDSEGENERGARRDQKVTYPVPKMGLGVKKK